MHSSGNTRLVVYQEIDSARGWWYICFCRAQPDKNIITCSNSECPYKDFHIPCLGLESVTIPKTWYCPHCSRLPQFKRKRGKSHALHKYQQNAFNTKAPLCDKVCVCEVKATSNDRLLECHNQRCSFSTLVVFD